MNVPNRYITIMYDPRVYQPLLTMSIELVLRGWVGAGALAPTVGDLVLSRVDTGWEHGYRPLVH